MKYFIYYIIISFRIAMPTQNEIKNIQMKTLFWLFHFALYQPLDRIV